MQVNKKRRSDAELTKKTIKIYTGRFVLVLFALYAGQAFAQLPQGTHIKFENVADGTQGLSG